jgi:hypothetical protein
MGSTVAGEKESCRCGGRAQHYRNSRREELQGDR